MINLLRLVLLFAALGAESRAQTGPISLADAVARAENAYPALRISQSQIDAAAAGVRLARTAYLPHVEGLAQLNRGTHNNIFGPFFPQSVVTPISGPVVNNSFSNSWGSALGVMVLWEPIDFGQRRAGVETASAAQRRAEAVMVRTRHEVAVLTADAYLTILAADQTVAAARAAVERAGVAVRAARAVVEAQLRPGADLERAISEQAAANLQLLQAEQAASNARVTLAQMLAVLPDSFQFIAFGLLRDAGSENPAAATAEVPALLAHPALLEQRLAIDESKARSTQLNLAYVPKIQLMANLYARGSGARIDGSTGGAISGIGPNIANWVAGFQVSFPILELPSLRAKRDAERKRLEGENARLDLVRVELNAHAERARLSLDTAERIARQTPILVESARRAEAQMSARYKAGLGTMTELADAARTLAQAEIDHALARLYIWRARLAVAAARGNLGPFLESVKQAGAQ